MKGLGPSQSGLKAKPATAEADRLTEDEIAREKLGPRGVPGAPDTARMRRERTRIFPSPANSTGTPPDFRPLPIAAPICGQVRKSCSGERFYTVVCCVR